MKKRYKLLLAVVLLLLGAGAGVHYMLTPVSVETETAKAADLVDTFTAQGTLQPIQSTVLEATGDGTLALGTKKAGQSFRKGAVLFTIDNTTGRSALQRQIAALNLQKKVLKAQGSASQSQITVQKNQVKAQLETAQQQYNALFGAGGTAGAAVTVAQVAYDKAARDYQAALALNSAIEGSYSDFAIKELSDAVTVAEQNLIKAKNDGSVSNQNYYRGLIVSYEAQLSALSGSKGSSGKATDAAIRQLDITIADLTEQLKLHAVAAPYDGVLWETLVENGSYVTKNQPLARFYRNSGFLVRTELLSADALQLKTGGKASCALSDGTGFTAVIAFLSPVASEVVSSVGVSENRVVVELKPSALPKSAGAGHTVDLSFSVTAAKGVLSAPASAFVPLQTGSGLYLIRDGKAALTPVQTGLRRGGRVEVTGGLAVGDSIILDPYDSKISDGTRVQAAD